MNEENQRAICGATNRQGKPCQRAPVPGKKRCKLHGGATPKGGIGHPKHGIYAPAYSDEELALIDQLNERLGSVDDEINMVRIRLRRAQIAERNAQAEREKMLELAEVRYTTGGQASTTTLERATDFHGIIDRLSGRLGSLMKIRSELITAAAESENGHGEPLPWVD